MDSSVGDRAAAAALATGHSADKLLLDNHHALVTMAAYE
jgi:hypothetical protein